MKVKYIQYLIFFLAFTFLKAGISSAQSQYSYVSDREFRSPNDLFGYRFCPDQLGFEDGDKEYLSPGEICLSVTPGYLLISGGSYDGAYSINTIKTEKFGYRLELMDARDPTHQGSLKIFLNQYFHADVFVFRKSRTARQIVFYNALMKENQAALEEEYYTDKNELVLNDPDDIWGNTIRPIHILEAGRQLRVQQADSLEISFTETIDEESKKPKYTYHINLRFLVEDELSDEAGRVEKQTKFEVKKVSLLEGKNINNREQKYILDLFSKEAPDGKVTLYLNQSKAIIMIQMGARKFLMRGY